MLRIDGGRFSAQAIDKLVDAGGSSCSYKEAARVVRKQAGLHVAPTQIARLVQQVGEELLAERDRRVQADRHGETPPVERPQVDIACVQVDGGRIQTRAPDRSRGVHDAGWKESKVAALWKMTGPDFDHDPHPDPPKCFRDPEHVRKLVKELKSQRDRHDVDDRDDSPPPRQPSAQLRSWPPERVFRTCVATLRDVYAFGPPVAAEARRRGFHQARRQVFLGDGDAKNWTVHKLHFPHFTAITDFVHPVAYVYQAAAAVTSSSAAQWEQYETWLVDLWQGRVARIVAELETWARTLGPPPDDAAHDDPRRVVAVARTYLAHNAPRMNYAECRRQGLPITSCLVESLIKEFNRRVKGTEKFWNRPEGAEAILQVRAALLSDGDPLPTFVRARPGRLHHRRTTAPLPPRTRRERN